jgi:hypothetical protein
MNAALFTKSTTGLILASSLIAASTVLGHAQDAPIALGTLATYPLTSAYSTVPTGMATLGGHTFDMTSGKMINLATNASVSYAGSYQNPKAVHLLLNSANTYNWYSGTTVGTVLLTFSDTSTQSANLTVGANLREWYIGGFGVVNTVTDTTPSTINPYSTQVWTTTALNSTGTAVLDMVSVPVLTANATKTLTSVQVTNSNPYGGSLNIDLSGLTVEVTAPAPQPQPTCDRPGNSCNTPAAQNSQATKWQMPTAAPTATTPTDSDKKHANNGHNAT